MDTIKTYTITFIITLKAIIERKNKSVIYEKENYGGQINAKTDKEALEKFEILAQNLKNDWQKNFDEKIHKNKYYCLSFYDGWTCTSDKKENFKMEWSDHSSKIKSGEFSISIQKESLKIKKDYAKLSISECQENLTISEYNELLKDLGATCCPLMREKEN